MFPPIQENKRQNRTPSETTTATIEQETRSIESVYFTTFTWKDALQDKLDKISNKLNATITANKQQMENDFQGDLQNKLKDFQTTLMLSAENMITKTMNALTIAM